MALLAAFRIVPAWCYGLLAIVALCLAFEWHGRSVVQGRWDKERIARAAADQALIDVRTESNRMLARAQATTNLKVENDLQKALASADARVAAARAGGLRFAGTCAAAGPAPADGAGGSDGASTATVRLPDQVANDLFDLAGDADKIMEQARACQAWIREQGFAK